MPANWPALTLALAVALGSAYLVAFGVGRALHTALRSILGNEREALLEGPGRLLRFLVFAVTFAAIAVPALSVAGLQATVATDRERVIGWLFDSGLRIVMISLAAYLVIRIGSAAAQRFEREMSRGTGLDVIERTKRAQTLGRIVQKTLSVVVFGVAGLMILRELDLDITPVLTGAGIVGLAVGFGAQTLVRDVISGFFLILEDQVRVGDVAVVNGQGGLVEEINLRTIVLRDFEGVVHVFPNGEVKTLANRTKDFSYFVLDVGMAYGEDPDRVAAAVREAAQSMMDDPAFRPSILEPVEIVGVDAFGDSQITLRARIKTVPLKQWEVGRELRKRLIRTFKAHGIEIPFPQRTIWVRDQRPARPAGDPRQES